MTQNGSEGRVERSLATDLNPFFRCPRCSAAGQLVFERTEVVCSACDTTFGMNREIPILFLGDRTTQLDDIDYDAVYNTGIERSLDSYAFAASVVHPVLEKRYPNVLELGAGTGGFSVGLAAHLKCEHFVVSDISPTMLDICRRKTEPIARRRGINISYVCLDGEAPPLGRNCFDLVVAYGVVHHVSDFQTLFKHVAASLKPGGIFLCFEPNLKYHRMLSFFLGEILAKLRAMAYRLRAKKISIGPPRRGETRAA